MAFGQNFAVKLCGILQSQSSHDIKAREWRLVGQEQDGSQLLTWTDENYVCNIGVYSSKRKSFDVLYTFDDHLNIIQASVNSSHTLLVYVVKEKAENANGDLEDIYKAFMITLRSTKNREIIDIANGDNKQMMVQFLYGKSHKYNPTCHNDKFILFTHLTCIKIYFTKLVNSDSDDELDDWDLVGTLPSPDIIVKTFSWAQWDCVHQVLYYIHYRQPTQSFAEGEEVKSPSEIMPTLSALQFHADLPHETVLNIPLSLPQLPTSNTGPACGQYEDDPVPLRIHDCSLDLQIVSDPSGVVCICHHYLYKPLDDSTSSLVLEDSTELKDSGVNFAYSITLLHHGCVVHSVVPDVPWNLAKSLRPSFTLYGDNHLLVRIPNLYTHLLDIGLTHEPCCHIVLPNTNSENGPSLSTLLGWSPNTMVDLSTLDIVTISVTEKELIAAFKSDISVENKISILHYFIQHECNSEAADELISWLCVNQRDTFGALQKVMEEYLIATSYTATKKSLPTSALPLTRLLPYTQHTKFIDVKIRDVCISVSQEKLWNTAVVLLAPRQRVAQFAEDLWTRLWEYLTLGSPRFKCSQVLEKLRVSLDCYQPEALSRCTTPMSPCTSAPFMANPTIRRSSTTQGDFLPFFEVDMCTASKQEHIISVNLREMSMHLLRNASAASGGRNTSGRFPTGTDSGSAPSHVHAVATRWAGAQLEASRQLCLAVCRGVAATTKNNQHRGFSFIDDMDEKHAFILFKILETYYLAADSIAFPLPQGFTSFFTYLGYRTMSFPAFLQYVHRNTFELQIDVMKTIIATKDDNNKTAVNNKLRLIQLIGDGRARRALGSWNNRASLQLRARDHAATLLSGHGPPMTAEYSQNMHYKSYNLHQKKGLAAFPSGERLSPLDTFLDLLTAKASLNELDFNLIIEATLSAINNE